MKLPSLKPALILFSALFIVQALRAQSVEELFSGNKISLRGLSVVDDNTVWVSGNKGTVGKSTDGGKTWNWMNVKGFDSTDFRDIEAFSDKTAIIMAVASPAYILKTTDGGANWKTVYQNNGKDMFLDAMDFYDEKNGVVVGDPINNKLFIAKTSDGGNSWVEVPESERPTAGKNEAFFASSGTNIRMTGKNEYIFITGGEQSRLSIKGKLLDVPFAKGKETAGGNSVAMNKNIIIAVGGDFNDIKNDDNICYISTDGGKTWTDPDEGLVGYLSCVEFFLDDDWFACGLRGVDYTGDNGKSWMHISNTAYNVCRRAKKGKAVYFAGGNGRIGKYN